MPTSNKGKATMKTNKAPKRDTQKPVATGKGAQKMAMKEPTGKRTMIDGKNRAQKPGKQRLSDDTPV